MLAMGSCGIVLVALGSSMSSLALNVGKKSTDIGNVFISRGMGSIAGAIVSSKLYVWCPGNLVMAVSLTLIAVILFILPHNTSIFGLHIFFLFLGFQTSVIDTGCQILTRLLHGKSAGPWLGANTVVFGLAASVVPIIEIYFQNLESQYQVICVYIILVTVIITVESCQDIHRIVSNCLQKYFPPSHLLPPEKTPTPTTPASSRSSLLELSTSGRGQRRGYAALEAVDSTSTIELGPVDVASAEPYAAPHYWVEVAVAVMVFSFVGGSVAATAYLEEYVSDTNILDGGEKAQLILAFWVAITVGRLLGVRDQVFLTHASLVSHLSAMCMGGMASILLIITLPWSPSALWMGVTAFGLFHGPCVGYCYDLNNRLTYPTEKSMAIVMFGLNCGASFVPYFTTWIWRAGGGSMTLMVVLFVSMMIPLPLLHATSHLSYEQLPTPDGPSPRPRRASSAAVGGEEDELGPMLLKQTS